MNSTLDYKPAGFFRRMVALFYDLILIIALCVGLTLLITYALNTEVESPLMYLVFLALGVGFYCYFWKKNKGQTLGMQVWKVRLAQENNLPLLAQIPIEIPLVDESNKGIPISISQPNTKSSIEFGNLAQLIKNQFVNR